MSPVSRVLFVYLSINARKITKTQNTPTYYFIVQDHTAGIIVDLGTPPYDLVQVGDSISGLCGSYNNTRGITTDFLAVNESLRQNIVVKNRNNEVKGIEVTFAEILADKKLYENRVVTVRNVQLGSVFHQGTDYMPEDATEGCFIQGTDTIYYTTSANAGGFTFYDNKDFEDIKQIVDFLLDNQNSTITLDENMDITGVVDDRIIGTTYSVWPLSQAHIINLDETACDNVEMNARIYSANQTIFIETHEGANIALFTLQGQSLYTTKATTSLTQISNISEKCVIILVDNVAYKMIVK